MAVKVQPVSTISPQSTTSFGEILIMKVNMETYYLFMNPQEVISFFIVV